MAYSLKSKEILSSKNGNTGTHAASCSAKDNCQLGVQVLTNLLQQQQKLPVVALLLWFWFIIKPTEPATLHVHLKTYTLVKKEYCLTFLFNRI